MPPSPRHHIPEQPPPEPPSPGGAPFHVGLSAEAVIDAAVGLTRGRGLARWSIRDLARELGTSTSAVYHHVGGKDALERRVVERVLLRVPVPDPALAWQDWFRAVLLPARPLLVEYPGVAKWLMMHGPAFPGVTPIIDAGIAALQRAGFGDRAGYAYAALFNTAVLTVGMRDDRMLHEADGPRDHAAMMKDFATLLPRSDGLAVLSQSLLEPMTRDATEAESFQEGYYRAIIETLIRGLEAELDAAAGQPTTSSGT